MTTPETKPKKKPVLQLSSGCLITFDLDQLESSKKLLNAALDTLGKGEWGQYFSGDQKSSMTHYGDADNAGLMRNSMQDALAREATGLHPIDWTQFVKA